MESTAVAGEKLTDKQKYDFKRAIEEIRQLHGRGTELISLYIPPDKQIYDVAAYLRNEYSQSSNIKSQSTRKNVQGAIQSILSRLKAYKKPPPNGLVIFIGEVAVGGDQTRMTQFVLEPPEPITTFLYRCDSEFYLDPLLDMLTEKKAYGMIVIDRSEATIGVLRGKRVQAIKNIQSLVPSKHRMGGQSALRFERLIEIAAHEFFTKVAETANEVFLNMKDLQGILIGGPGPTKDYFYESGYLHHELQKKVIDTFDTGYTDEYGLRELMEKAKERLEDLDLMREKRLMQRLLEEIRKSDGGLAAYGEEEVRNNLLIGAVDTLLVSEALRKRRIGLECSNCGYKQVSTMDKSPDNPLCPRCGSQASITTDVDLIDEFYELADKVGTKVELISNDSEEGEMLLKAFGGIAAILRFKPGG
ncbi:MAG: peptide chain release factor aRF-1 [Methanomassiliicoccales archaeon]|jgi:peptide chain release factor subunit 1|nr:peptide chain release factor aRF-1 [Methanomassiliicoccales archaeon]